MFNMKANFVLNITNYHLSIKFQTRNISMRWIDQKYIVLGVAVVPTITLDLPRFFQVYLLLHRHQLRSINLSIWINWLVTCISPPFCFSDFSLIFSLLFTRCFPFFFLTFHASSFSFLWQRNTRKRLIKKLIYQRVI